MSTDKTLKENLNSALNKTDVSCSFYFFDINRRVYEKDGIKSNSPFYSEHFIKINIIGETEKEYLCEFGRSINKRSMLYKINGSTMVKIYNQKEKDDLIYEYENANRLSEIVRKLKADKLKEIERLIG